MATCFNNARECFEFVNTRRGKILALHDFATRHPVRVEAIINMPFQIQFKMIFRAGIFGP